MQVATYTKSLFAAEYLQWRKTATAALDLEVEKPQPEAMPAMAGLDAEPPTAGPTMALRPGVSWSDGRSELRSARPSRSRSRSSQSQRQGAQPRSGQRKRGQPTPRSRRPGSAGTGAGVVPRAIAPGSTLSSARCSPSVGGGAWMLTRHQEIPALGSPGVAPWRPPPAVATPDSLRSQPRPPPASRHGRDAASGPTANRAPSSRRRPAAAARRPGPRPIPRRGRRVSRASEVQAQLAHTVTRVPAPPPAAAATTTRRKRPRRATDAQKADPFAD